MLKLLIITSLVLSLGVLSSARESQEVVVPGGIKVPEGYKLHMKLCGEGYQYYRYNGSSWVLARARARLYDAERKEVGRHFYLPHPDSLGGQPSWESLPSKGVPHSVVTAKALVKVSPDPASIPWLLLQTTHTQGDKSYFGDVVYVQRYNTSKGLAPSSVSGAKVGRVRRTSYSAFYAFYLPDP